jgi:tripeptide aminopeptidase
MLKVGVTPIIKPIRGGTDGARLSHMGLPCPNIFTGGLNSHSRAESVSLKTMQKAVQTIIEIARLELEPECA